MCFSGGGSNPKADPVVAAAPPPPAIPATQSSVSAAGQPGAQAAEPVQQIGFARKRENKKRFGSNDGPRTRRLETAATGTATGSGIRM